MTPRERLADKIAALNYSRGFVDNFDSFLDFALFPFLANPEQHERENFAAHQQDEKYLEALQLLGELSEGYRDALGDIFMDRISHGANGQFFTPETICEFMAKITDVDGCSVCDPCCGSGRMLLAGMKNSREEHHIDPYVYGGDLDHRAVRMALLNVCLNSAYGDMEWINTLLLEVYKTYHIDRVLINGRWMSQVWQYDKETDMNALNREREQQRIELLKYGILYERRIDAPQSTNDIEVSNLPPKEEKPLKSQETAPQTQPAKEQPLQPIPQPKREPIQLSLFD